MFYHSDIIFGITEIAGETFSDLFCLFFPLYLLYFQGKKGQKERLGHRKEFCGGAGTGGGVMVTVVSVPCYPRTVSIHESAERSGPLTNVHEWHH